MRLYGIFIKTSELVRDAFNLYKIIIATLCNVLDLLSLLQQILDLKFPNKCNYMYIQSNFSAIDKWYVYVYKESFSTYDE